MKCYFCGTEIDEFSSNNPAPFGGEDDFCCSVCNGIYVLPARRFLIENTNPKTRDGVDLTRDDIAKDGQLDYTRIMQKVQRWNACKTEEERREAFPVYASMAD